MSKHIPLFNGPFWMFDNGFRRKIIDDDGAEVVSTSCSGLSAEELDSQKATLLVLSAAHDLLKAAEYARDKIEKMKGELSDWKREDAISALLGLKQAIAKAEGRNE